MYMTWLMAISLMAMEQKQMCIGLIAVDKNLWCQMRWSPWRKKLRSHKEARANRTLCIFSSEVEWWYHPIKVAPADLEDDTQENGSLFGFQLQSFWELFQIWKIACQMTTTPDILGSLDRCWYGRPWWGGSGVLMCWCRFTILISIELLAFKQYTLEFLKERERETHILI